MAAFISRLVHFRIGTKPPRPNGNDNTNDSLASVEEESQQEQRGHKVDTSQPQFTWRAIVVGLLFGTVLCFSNL
ncbi:hypothetical protein H4217_002924, partial [Coemansia sp. RSA 1939]